MSRLFKENTLQISFAEQFLLMSDIWIPAFAGMTRKKDVITYNRRYNVMISRFLVQKISESGRVGRLRTAHGELSTPFFMPDATRASVRGLSSQSIFETGVEAMVVNTYHLMLQPGMELMQKAGGVHAFMRWNGPLLSDSGGYQVYSLIHKHPDFGKVTEDGALFRSPIDGKRHFLTPETSIDIQFDLGVDMMVCFDDPRPNDADPNELVAAVERTIRWAKRCKNRYEEQLKIRRLSEESRPLLFGVVQGGMDIELRKQCASALVDIGFDGYGFGARHVDVDGNFLEEVLRKTAECIPEESIRFALGIGTLSDIARAASYGWDMFDCVIPTREGRHGRAFLLDRSFRGDLAESVETITITNERFREDFLPLDTSCKCMACGNSVSRAYIRHLFSVGEPLGSVLLSAHNLRTYSDFLLRIRDKISES